MKTAPLLVVVGSAKLLVSNGKFVCGALVICGVLVEVDVKIGGIDSVVDADLVVLEVLESVSVSDSVLELLVRAAGGEKVGGPGGGGVVGDGKDEVSSSSSSSISSAFVSALSSASSFNVSALSSSLFTNEIVLSKEGVCRPSRMSSSSCCLVDMYAAAHCSPLRRALERRRDQQCGPST